jgi:hypothetical protein
LFTVKFIAVEVPPLGIELTAVNERVPAVAKSEEGRAALTCVALMYVVALAEPFTLMTVVGTKPVPVTVTMADAVPAMALVGDKDAIVGAGLSTSKLVEVPDPLLNAPLNTTTGISAPLASWVAGTGAVNCVALT